MDKDSTTIANMRDTVNPDISKQSDSNHTKKGFARILVNLSTSHKVLKNLKVRAHIQRWLTHCMKQARGCADHLSCDLLKMKIVPHLYGKYIISSNKHSESIA